MSQLQVRRCLVLKLFFVALAVPRFTLQMFSSTVSKYCNNGNGETDTGRGYEQIANLFLNEIAGGDPKTSFVDIFQSMLVFQASKLHREKCGHR